MSDIVFLNNASLQLVSPFQQQFAYLEPEPLKAIGTVIWLNEDDSMSWVYPTTKVVVGMNWRALATGEVAEPVLLALGRHSFRGVFSGVFRGVN